MPVPDADPTDGMLDVLLVRKVSRAEIPGIIGKYKNGRYRELPDYVRYIKTDSVKVFCDKPAAVNLDGETRMAREVEMKVAEEKIRFFYPRGLSWQAKQPAAAK